MMKQIPNLARMRAFNGDYTVFTTTKPSKKVIFCNKMPHFGSYICICVRKFVLLWH